MNTNLNSWHSYPSIYNLGHRAVSELLTVPVIVEEKVDGSQFSFGAFIEDDDSIVLRVRSKGAVMLPDAPEKMFTEGVETAKRLLPQLHVGWTYRGEYLKKPRHNGLHYNRVPAGHVILFDINTGLEAYLNPEEKQAEADRLGLECVPNLFTGLVPDIATFRQFLERESVLGGQPIEGVVVKPLDYALYGRDKKVLFGKFVSEAFKEIQTKAWKQDNPTHKDILTILGSRYSSPARWQKAVIHLREKGLLNDAPQDIALLIKEVPDDIEKECREEIADALYKWAWPDIRRSVTKGLPEWYKEELLKRQFEHEEAA